MAEPATPPSPRNDPLSTSHLLQNLGQRTASNTLITTAAQALRFAINIASMLVLARLLTPQDFGLVAMVTAVTGFLEVFKDAGLSTATVQKENITQAQVSNLFWVNVGVGVVITLVVVALAPVLSWFYQETRLVPVALALSVTFLLTAASVQHQAILRRQMRFAALSTIQVASAVVGLVIAIVMACTGWGYWALVGSILSTALVNSIVTWLISGWAPGLPKRAAGTIPLLGFGAHLTGAAIVQTVIGSADTLLIGKAYGAEAVGLYTRGGALLLNPLNQFFSPFNAVLVPTLSRVEHDPERYRRAFLQIQNTLALIAMPAAGFLLASSQPIVHGLLGEKWLATIPIFTAFAVFALYAPLANATTWLFTTQGRGQEVLTTSILLALISLLAIISGLPYGPVGVALCFSLTGITIRLPILYYYAGRSGPVRTKELWACLLRHVPLSLLSFAGAYWVNSSLSSVAPLLVLAVSGPVCFGLVAVYIRLSPVHRKIAKEVIDRFRSAIVGRLQRRKSS